MYSTILIYFISLCKVFDPIQLIGMDEVLYHSYKKLQIPRSQLKCIKGVVRAIEYDIV